MSTLSINTAIRRSLIESIRLTLADTEEWETMSEVDGETYDDLAEAIADNLIDSDWVTRDPSVPVLPSFKFPQVPALPNTDWWQPSPNWQFPQVWCVA